MIIRRLHASFGKLKSRELLLGNGLNVVEAPNESGKSTWCAFIRTMLYGLGSERDKTGFLSDKTRFHPWDGSAMEGVADFEYRGGKISVSRTAGKRQPMGTFSAMVTDTAQTAEGFTSENAGELLTGLPRSVFDRTAFIRQAGVRVDQDAELEKRISSIVSSGDETVSYTETNDLLQKWRRGIRHNRAVGTLPVLEETLSKAEAQLLAVEKATEDLSSERQTVEGLKAREAQLEKDLETHKKLEAQGIVKQLRSGEQSFTAASDKVKELAFLLTVNGRQITREDTADARSACAAFAALEPMATKAKADCAAAADAFVAAEKAFNTHPYSGKNPAEAEVDAKRAGELAERPAVPKKKRPAGAYVVLALAAAAWAALSWYFYPIGIAAGAVILGLAVYFFLVRGPSRTAPDTELTDLLTKYGAENAEALRTLSAEFTELSRKYEAASAALSGAKQALQNAVEMVRKAEMELQSRLKPVLGNNFELKAVPTALSEKERLLDAYTAAAYAETSARERLETLKAQHPGATDNGDGEFLVQPLRNREDTLSFLDRTRRQLREESEKYNIAKGQLRSLGDPMILRGEIAAMQAEIEKQTAEYDGLTLAIDTLTEAEEELQNRFSPLISRKAGELMGRLTGGRYDRLTFDREFSAMARAAGDTVPHTALSLSEGTSDQLYLALRIAMCLLLPDGGEPCPLILDDALSNFDDARTALALDLLSEIAENRQVILFTCHSREGTYLSGRKNVLIVRPREA